MDTLLPPSWKRPSGYSDGVLMHGKLCFVAGQVGWNPVTGKFETDDFTQQFDQALGNVLSVVRAAGGTAEHIARLTIYVTDKKRYLASLKDLGEVYKKHMHARYPAMSLLQVSGLLEDRAQVEIEATAVIP